MAAITSVAIGAVSAGYAIYNGAKQKKEAKNALDSVKQPEARNTFQDLPISTLGSELIREEAGRTSASVVDAARNAGIRGVFGIIPRIQAQNNEMNRDAQLLLDNQIMDKNKAIAEDERRIQGVQEGRYNSELAGIGRMMDVGQKYTDQGIRGLANTALYAANNIDWSKDSGSGEGGSGGSRISGVTMGMNPMRINTSMMGSFTSNDLLEYQKRKAKQDALNSMINGYGSTM